MTVTDIYSNHFSCSVFMVLTDCPKQIFEVLYLLPKEHHENVGMRLGPLQRLIKIIQGVLKQKKMLPLKTSE